MQIFKGIDHLPNWEKPVVAVGAFDGVHLGHVRILSFLREQAEKVGGTSVVMTFDPQTVHVTETIAYAALALLALLLVGLLAFSLYKRRQK